MKKNFILSLSALLAIGIVVNVNHHQAIGSGGGAPAGSTGSPGDGNTCATSPQCHMGGPSATNETVNYTTDIPSSGYVPGTTYNISVNMLNGGSKFGFSVSPQDQSGNLLGQLIASGAGTALNGPGGSKYITHTLTGTSGSGSKTWTFEWIAPAVGTGDVTFYGAFNFSNGNFSASGDIIVTHSETYSENTSTSVEEGEMERFTVFPNPVNGDEIHVRMADVDEVIMVRMVSLEGKVLIEKPFKRGNISLDLSQNRWGSGVYLLQLQSKDHTTTQRVVVN